jgi:hypothetical protein
MTALLTVLTCTVDNISGLAILHDGVAENEENHDYFP